MLCTRAGTLSAKFYPKVTNLTLTIIPKSRVGGHLLFFQISLSFTQKELPLRNPNLQHPLAIPSPNLSLLHPPGYSNVISVERHFMRILIVISPKASVHAKHGHAVVAF
jgi:hypothetical protein